MAVSPDLLLNLKAPAAVAKAAGAAARPATQPSRDEPSSFANVYARERQAKPAEPQQATAKPVRDKPVADKPSQETDEAGGTDAPAATEDGKDLPVEAAADAGSDTGEGAQDGAEDALEAELDPLLLFGMGGSAPVETTEALPEDPAVTGEALLASLSLTSAAATPNGDAQAATVATRTAGIEPGGQKSGSVSLLPGQAPDASADAAQTLPAEELVLGETLGKDAEDSSLEPDFGDVLDSLSAPGESRAEAGDAALNRISPLTQAITQQNQVLQTARPTLVPGQPVQMQQSGWSEAVVDRVMWLSSQNLKSAEIQLDPAELGRMEVRIDMNKDQAQVTFMSPHAGVRDVLEGQMQRLRDMFTQQGMSMDVNVSDQSRGWRGEGGGDGDGRGRRGAGSAVAGDEEVVRGSLEIGSSRATGGRGLVDYYA